MLFESKLVEKEGEFFDNINSKGRSLRKDVSNCMGTALYLVDEMSEDIYIYGDELEKILNELSKEKSPRLGALIGWRRGDNTYHLGIITSIDPLLITPRRGVRGKLYKNHPFEKVEKIYKKEGRRIEYFIPKKLEQMVKKNIFS